MTLPLEQTPDNPATVYLESLSTGSSGRMFRRRKTMTDGDLEPLAAMRTGKSRSCTRST